MMITLDLPALTRIAAERIVYCLVEGTLVAGFAACLLRVVRRQNAGTRFAVWFSALVAIAALPLFGGPWWTSAIARGNETHASASAMHSAFTLPASWALYLFGVWAAIAGFSLLRVGIGVWQLKRLRKSCVPIDRRGLDPALREILSREITVRQKLGTINRCINRTIECCVSDRVQSPTAIGLMKAAVVLPSWLLQELSAKELEQILVHELAHLRRWDDWTNLAQKILKALLFFHPAVWWIENKLSLEREMACDDAVLLETSPRAYAECLARLAEKTFLRRSLALAQAAVSHIGQTTQRVAQILDVNRPSATTRVWKPAVSLVAAFAIGCVVSASRAPKLVAFEDRADVVPHDVLPHAVVPHAQVAMAAVAVPVHLLARLILAHPVPAPTPVHLLQASGARSRVMTAATPQPGVRPSMSPSSLSQSGMSPSSVLQAQAGRWNLELPQLGLHPNGIDFVFVPDAVSPGQPPFAYVSAKDDTANRWAVSETVLVFTVGGQRGTPGSVMYQMCVWRITVLPAASTPAEKAVPQRVI